MCYDVTLCHRHDWDVQMQLHPDCTAMTTFRPDATLLLQLLRWSSAHAPLLSSRTQPSNLIATLLTFLVPRVTSEQTCTHPIVWGFALGSL